MNYRIELSARCESDLGRIFNWLYERSPDGAARWYESFWDATERLKRFPLACSVAAESHRFSEQVRCMLFGTTRGRTYRALFVVRGDVAHLLCVRGPGERAVKPKDIQESK
jgi:plasmid stabilization system protein ParE